MSERPLHVRVAEALGCRPTEIRYRDDSDSWWQCHCPSSQHNYRDDSPVDGMLLDYDTSWDATGPLIERFGISLWSEHGWEAGFLNSAEYEGHWLDDSEKGATPLLAVCHLILALSEAGLEWLKAK